ncbi:ferric reductase-like transmembrane domain-containing protein [Puniceicoccus vermicola]|uniref:Ferric reductase-like transmembrane domain-containing protein n=1 Tax=Puniceicoccus vermicola TaxID=388746 RepID=A0A7X1E2V3_9BACT|nr:ferric reductase-like transmembrane domain-containing protein [Puniceicoccus vermicola]MBC2600860.1 ferric reductase-like transmembrane domain-containing protein [Puniceicoccus vermicola]
MLPSLIRKRTVFFTLLSLPGLFVLASIYAPSFNSWQFRDIQNFLGNIAMFLLIFVLSLTPLIQLFPRWRLAQALNTHRRSIGISCYIYASLHLLCYIISLPSSASILQDFQEFLYLQLGLAAFILLTPLFLTSNSYSVRVFGYKPWKILHRLAYIAAIAVFLHRSLGEEIQLFQTLLIFFPLFLLESLRILKNLFGLFKKKGSAPPPVIRKPRPKPAWEGYRDFRVARKEPNPGEICSFYLEPVDGQPLPPFLPGQYLTFKFEVPGQAKPVLRCYSLSDAPAQDHYRISVKLQRAPRDVPTAAPGISSTHLHATVQEGDILQVKAPAGKFTLEENVRKIALVSSGVGITPMLSMLYHRINQGLRDGDEIWFFHGARTRGGHFTAEELEKIADKNPQLQIRVCYSRPTEGEKQIKQDFQIGRLGAGFIRTHLPSKDYDFYICGPNAMMAEVVRGLEDWEIAPERIHFEAFGPSSVKRTRPLPKSASEEPTCTVTFAQSQKELEWTGEQENLLELGEAAGLTLPFGCRSGVCGACKQEIASGEVEYDSAPAADPGEHACLLCQAKPKGDLILKA